MATEPKEKKKLETPHTFVILFFLLVIAVIATHFIPAGEFVRYKDEVSGRTIVEAGSYAVIESNPVGFLQIPVVIYRAIVKAANVFVFLLVIGGSFELVTETGAIAALCRSMAKAFKGKELAVIPIFLVLFSVFGTTMGMSTEVAVFVPIGISLALSLGMDKVTGLSMMAMGAASGFTAGLLNPFNVGVAQDIAQVPLFSGMWLRAILLVVLLAVDCAYIVAYTKRVQKDPTKSICYGLQDDTDYSVSMEGPDMTGAQKAVLGVVALSFAAIIFGLMKLDWYFEEMAGIFIAMGIIAGIIGRFSPNKIARVFGVGAKSIVVGALIVGIARSIEVALSDAKVIDTLVYWISDIVNQFPPAMQGVGMFLAQSLINCFITSGTGQAAVVMPLITPVADLVGMSRQTAVLAFQMGDGFSNSILPTSSATMGYLAVSGIPLPKWLKFMVPLFLIWTLIGCLFMVFAVAIGY